MAAAAFAFTKIIVGDLAASERFYTEVLGLTVVTRIVAGTGRDAIEETVLEVPGAPAGGCHLNIVRYVNRSMPEPGEAITGFMVTDVDATVKAALEAGGAIVHPAQDLPEYGLRLAFVKDPEGHVIEILQTVDRNA